jgi:hypothetical protein
MKILSRITSSFSRLSKRVKIFAIGAGVAIILIVLIMVTTGIGGDVVTPCKGGYIRSTITKTCVRAGDPNFGETRSGEREHTPEEEAAHKKSLETSRRGEEEGAAAQKKVEEDETQGGEHSIRHVEEKVCYESGKTAEECKGPFKETPQEERTQAENRQRQIETGELQVHE